MGDNDDSGSSPNDNFSGVASQHFVYAAWGWKLWELKLEGSYTRAPARNEEQRGYFAYRLTDRNGSSKGAYELWWDARSDWNADDEKAVFVSLRRSLDDMLPFAGFSVGMGAALGCDGRAYGTSAHLKEWAFTMDLEYTRPSGLLKGAFAKLHFTHYRNDTDFSSWEPYKNAFQSERDIKFFAGIPFDL